MNLHELKLVVNTLVAEKKPSVNIPTEQWDVLLNIAQLKHYKRKLGLPEEYIPGHPRPAQEYAITQRIDDDLAAFSVHLGRAGTMAFTISSVGEATLPLDFFYPTGMIYHLVKPDGTIREKQVEILNDKEWNDYVTSQVITQTKEFPIANMKSGYVRFLPKNLQRVDFTYLRKPVKPVYAVTNTQGYIAYDAANSVQLEWDEPNQLDILYILLSDIGIVTEKADIYQISEKIKDKGI